jgi:thiosulfate/3-mercaptopyruvate sulfurtransferase
MAATTAFAVIATVLSGLGPALKLSKADHVTYLKAHAADGTPVHGRRFTARNEMVVGQIALSLKQHAQGGQFASRLWWLARWVGHRRVALLDGGWPKWSSETHLTSQQLPTRARGTFTAGDSIMPLATVDQVLQRLNNDDHPLLDARTPERFRGEEEPIDPVAGHIPGARNRPWQHNLNPDQTFKSPRVLRSEFDALLNTHTPDRVTHQCGSGVTACHNVFAMELAGLPGSALYGGSWSEWIANPARPVATG